MIDEQVAKIFLQPKIIGIVADTNQGKSNLVYYLINELKNNYTAEIFSYGLKMDCGEQKIYSLEELERIKNSVIICDEFQTLFDLTDRKKRLSIETTLRLLHHNNNIFILCGLPDNFKKFISSRLECIFYKFCSISNFINGSTIKNIALSYKGVELGSMVLNIPLEKVLFFDGHHYKLLDVPYLIEYDTKKNNKIICEKIVQ